MPRHLTACFLVLALCAAGTLAWAATETPNLALKKTATASGAEDNNPAANAVDGDAETRWCNADGATDCWWQVDLEKAQDLGGLEITWEHDGAVYNYMVEGSVDGKKWALLTDQRGSTSATQVQKLLLSGPAARYVKITVTGLEDGSWASFFEVKVIDGAGMKKLTPEETKAYHGPAPIKSPATTQAK